MGDITIEIPFDGDMQCNECGEIFPETGDGSCPFCGSSDVEEVDDDEE